MAEYLLHEKCYMPGGPGGLARVYEAGETVTIPDEMVPGPFMEPKDAAAKKAFLACVDRKTGAYVPPKPRVVEELPMAVFAGFDISAIMETPDGR
jgi:hypothetical protein